MPTSGRRTPGGIIERTAGGLAAALAVALMVAVLVNLANIVGRYVFSWGFLAADEIQVFVMVWITFVGAALQSWRDRHLRMDLVTARFPGAVRKALQVTELVLLASIGGFAAFQSVHFAWLMARIGRASETAGIPMVIPHGALVVGFALISVFALLRLARVARWRARK